MFFYLEKQRERIFEWIKTGKKEFMMYIVFDKLPIENYHLTISINEINQAYIVIIIAFVCTVCDCLPGILMTIAILPSINLWHFW